MQAQQGLAGLRGRGELFVVLVFAVHFHRQV